MNRWTNVYFHQATTWTLTALCTISLITRLYLRWRLLNRLFWDDFFVVLAWVFSIPLAAQVTVSLNTFKTARAGPPRGSIFISRPLVQFFFYSCIWCIKISFLIFFKRIAGVTVRSITIYWRVVLSFTILSYLIAWALNPYSCWVNKGMQRCNGDPASERLFQITFPLAAALDVFTDLLSKF